MCVLGANPNAGYIHEGNDIGTYNLNTDRWTGLYGGWGALEKGPWSENAPFILEHINCPLHWTWGTKQVITNLTSGKIYRRIKGYPNYTWTAWTQI